MFQNPWYGQVGAPAAEDGNQQVSPPPASAEPVEEAETTSSEVEVGAVAIDPIAAVQQQLKSGWTAHVLHDERLFYCK